MNADREPAVSGEAAAEEQAVAEALVAERERVSLGSVGFLEAKPLALARAAIAALDSLRASRQQRPPDPLEAGRTGMVLTERYGGFGAPEAQVAARQRPPGDREALRWLELASGLAQRLDERGLGADRTQVHMLAYDIENALSALDSEDPS
jgi:hypothetical protein